MSFIFKTLDFNSQYKQILNNQKDLIKNNRYARELEEKYHRTNRKYLKSSISKKSSDNIQIHNWPVESNMFTKVLKSRLDLAFNKKNSGKSQENSRKMMTRPQSHCRYSFNDVKIVADKEKTELNLCMNKKPLRKNSIRMNSYQRYRSSSNNNDSPHIRNLARIGAESSLNESIENNLDEDIRDIQLISIPRYY